MLYIPSVKCNFLSIVQLFEKDYKIHMEKKKSHIMDANDILILKAQMASNRTFKIESKVINHMCLATAAS